MSTQDWTLVSIVANLGFTIYIWASAANAVIRSFRPDAPRTVARRLRGELKPFALPLFVVNYIASIASGDAAWSANFILVLNAITWWVWRKDKDDDDRWKKRRKKLASKVAVLGGRLQVVPAGSQS